MKELVALLMDIVKSGGANDVKVRKFQDLVFDSEPELYDSEDQEDIFRNLATDLDDCFSDQGTLNPEKTMRVIREALEELKKL
jgi:hypothetical protein